MRGSKDTSLLTTTSLEPCLMEPNRSAAESDKLMLEMRKYILLLAILAMTVTYVAGLNPPGGVWLDTQGGHVTGNQVLVVTYHTRYNAFSYSNATAFMASGVVILLLLLSISVGAHGGPLFVVLRWVMVLDLLALVVAYIAGASRDTFTTAFAPVLASPIFFYVLHNFCKGSAAEEGRAATGDSPSDVERKRKHKILMLLAIFATTIAYMAGLNPPGGFWPDTQDGHLAGDSVLQYHHRRRFIAFFVCNTASFVASLFVIMMLLTSHVAISEPPSVYLSILISLLGLVGAYASGSCRETDSTAGVIVIYMVGLVLVLVYFACVWLQRFPKATPGEGENAHGQKRDPPTVGVSAPAPAATAASVPVLIRVRSIVLLLATLGVTVTYTAGLNPPGGFWPDDRDGHKGGDPILLAKHATRYRLFLYFNSTALAASMVVVFMVQTNFLNTSGGNGDGDASGAGGGFIFRRRHALWTVLLLDMTSLIGAYAAGCSREASTSIYVIALAGAALFYVVFHMGLFTHQSADLHTTGQDDVEKKRKLLLLLAVLAATLTYQAGLTPPGGFWLSNDGKLGHRAGDPVLMSNYPRRYTAFFYLNAASFMASITLIIILLNHNLYRHGVRCHALCACMVAGLLSLMGAYAAGSSRHLWTSIFMILLVALVFSFVVLLLLIALVRPGLITEFATEGGTTPRSSRRQPAVNGTAALEQHRHYGAEHYGNITPHTWQKYLMLLGILAASVTYQAGLAPPGGVWPDNNDGHAVGNPILHDSNSRRYHIFFYCNSVSFMASVVVITLLLLVKIIPLPRASATERTYDKLLKFLVHTMMIVNLMGLLGAYAAGSSREWETFGYIVALVAVVPLYIVLQLLSFQSFGTPSATGENGPSV